MNRRNFIKTCAVASLSIPSVMVASAHSEPLERVKIQSFINILTIEELKENGIRAATYSANCVDKNGIFAHERGYQDLRGDAPFVRNTFKLHSLPSLYTNDIKNVYRLKQKLNENWGFGGSEYTKEAVFNEIKHHMEYVCLVGYAYLKASSEWPEKYIPIVGGLSKVKYKQLIKNIL